MLLDLLFMFQGKLVILVPMLFSFGQMGLYLIFLFLFFYQIPILFSFQSDEGILPLNSVSFSHRISFFEGYFCHLESH